jgi:tetratricopeptide (TPR) repeat protein
MDHSQVAAGLVAQGRWRDAEKEYRIYRNEHPDSVDAIVWHAEVLIRIGQPFDAALELQKFLGGHPDTIRALELHAVLASSTLHDPKGAEADLEKCVGLDPNDFFAWKSLGDLYLDQGEDDEAAAKYEKAVKLRPRDAVALASLAYVRSHGNSADAEVAFKRARSLSVEPVETVGVETLYGRYLLDAGRKEEAVEAFTQVLKVKPDSPDALAWRAQAYAGLEMWQKAEQDAVDALKGDKQDKRPALLLVKIYRQQKQAEKAAQYAQMVQAIATAEDEHYAMGRSLRDALGEAEPLLMKGDYVEAAKRYEAIVNSLPTFYEAYFDLGMCYGQTGRLPQAEAAFRKYLSFQPVSADGRASLAMVLLEQGRGAEAVPELKEAIEIDPTLTEARKALAREYLVESKPLEAAGVLSPAENEKDDELLVLLARALRRSGERSAALRAADRALELNPSNTEAAELRNAMRTTERQ